MSDKNPDIPLPGATGGAPAPVSPAQGGKVPGLRRRPPGRSGQAPVALVLAPGQVRRLPHWSDLRRQSIQKVWANKVSPRTAIKFQCLECVGEDVSAITSCADVTCPLWHFRPFQNKK